MFLGQYFLQSSVLSANNDVMQSTASIKTLLEEQIINAGDEFASSMKILFSHAKEISNNMEDMQRSVHLILNSVDKTNNTANENNKAFLELNTELDKIIT